MKKLSATLLIVLLAASGIRFAGAAATDIATVPVMNITGTGSIKPNIMLMLDDSGSMAWDYTPDQVNDSGKCFDGAACVTGSGTGQIFSPPYFSPEFNFQYYNPDLSYAPGVNSTGTSFGAQTTFTAVKTDPYGVQQKDQNGSSVTTVNVTTNYPDAVYCDSSSPASLTDTAHCKKNSAFTYPDPSGGVFVNAKRINGNPYYYRIATTKHCTDDNLTNCIAATAPTGAYIFPAPVRWCTSATTNFAYTNCQANFDTTHTTPEFVGKVKPVSPSAAAFGVASVVTAGSQYSITDMKVDGVSIINTTVTGADAATFATNLAKAINSSSFHSTPEYAACVGARKADVTGPPFVSGDNQCTGTPNTTVTIFPQTASCGTGTASISGCSVDIGTANNAKVITVAGPSIPGVAATGTITVGAGPAGSATYRLNAVIAGAATISTGAISVTGDLSTAAGKQAAAAAIASKIGAGYTATAANGVVTVTAIAAGAAGNGALSVTSGATRAAGTLTVGTIAKTTTYQLDSISAGGAVISTGPISASSSSNQAATRKQDVASAIAAAISLNGYTATASGGVVTITAPPGAAGNGTLTYAAPPPVATAIGSATLTVGANAVGGTYKISSIMLDTTTVASNISCPGAASTVVATCVRDAINAAGTNFTAAVAGSVVTITASQTGTYANGTLSVNLPAAVKSTATFSVTSATNAVVNNLKVLAGGSCTTNITAAPGILTGSTTSSSNTSTVASRIAAKVGVGYVANYSSGNSFPITAPTSLLNGCTLAPTTSSGSVAGNGTFGGGSDPMAITAAGGLSGGVNATTPIPVAATTDFAGGSDAIPVSSIVGISGGADGNLTAQLGITNFANGVDGNNAPIRVNVGTFTRTDIVACAGGAADTCYPKAATRTDCAAATGCTYNEEMINFGNWYAYYRTRMQTMKSAASLAFNPLGNSYRVGFAKLSNVGFTGGIDMTPADFNATNRVTWYTDLFAANPITNTPLRTALDNIGKMYANQAPFDFTGANRVVQYPCQQNFVILTTDGLWNQTYSGNVGNNDNVEKASRFCTKAGGCFDGITSSPTVPSLADVALYWYNGGSNTTTVSLRPDLEPSVATPGVVPAGPSDPNTHLHMTTFTLGLGVSGFMNYESNYDKTPTVGGDFFKLITGAGGCPWNGGGTFVWPNPTADSLQAVDDLWHAAVNGHGKYFSARSPAAVVAGLSAAIAAMAVRTGAASAAATSTPNVSQQDNDIFSATFTTVKWYGELFDQKIDPATGNVSSSIAWSSTNTVGQQVADDTDTRIIKMLDTSVNPPVLKDFLYSAMTATEQGWFNNKASLMVQYNSLAAADRAIANSGTNLVNWMRGQTQYSDDLIYRAYTVSTIGPTIPAALPIVLGDIDTAKPAYVRDPRKNYPGTYAAYVLAQKTRAPSVFAAANDGMLHSFNAANGDERWAYVPRITMSKLWKQAATDYGSNHQFSTDGSPEIADIQIGTDWKTVLVAGLNAGGRGYYAIDVTDPTAPVALWEFCADSTICANSDPDMGLTFGNPQIGFWNNKWVVMVSSGYNNIPGTDGVSSGSGIGYLYVLDAATGALLKKISTGTGDTTTPSGLSKITAITNNPQSDPNITYVYGGDNQGNLWRFDFTDATFTNVPVLKMATLGTAQPITTRPDVSLCEAGSGLKRVVLLGTGRLLGVSDTNTTGTQSVYLIKDSDAALGSLNGSTTMVQQTLALVAGSGGSAFTLTGTPNPPPVNLTTKNGWYVDLTLNPGERVNLDPKIAFSTAVLVSNLPTSASACTVGGTSFNYQFNLCTGSYADVTNQTVGGVLSNTSAAVGFIIIKLPSGTVKMISTTADGSKLTSSVKASASAAPRKSGWRTLKN